jgi:nitroreductase
MELIKLMQSRHSVRNYQKTQLDDTLLSQVLEAGRIAPSAVNFQPWCFIVINEEAVLKLIWEAYPRDWFKTAPQVIVICGDHSESWKRASDQKDHCDIDVAIAVDHMTLMAASMGLGTCWVCNFNPSVVREVLHLPENLEPIALLPIGFPVVQPAIENKKRKSLMELVHYNRFV